MRRAQLFLQRLSLLGELCSNLLELPLRFDVIRVDGQSRFKSLPSPVPVSLPQQGQPFLHLQPGVVLALLLLLSSSRMK